ncbi:MAG: phosphotransferase [Gammaproteobacteria bacterium]|nr:phosphotransferase [Gammaproteobacteria bacterium]
MVGKKVASITRENNWLEKDLALFQKWFFKKNLDKNQVKLLSGGFSGANNYRIEDSGIIYFARAMPNKQPPESRKKECFITEYVGKLGIGPKVYYQNPEQGILVSEFINGRSANYDDMVTEPNRSLIITKIRELHQSQVLDFSKIRTLADRIQYVLKNAGLTRLQEQLEALNLVKPLHDLFSCEESNLTESLVHGDLNPNNILIANNEVYFIDWTDAGCGDPFIDISWHALCFPICSQQQFLGYYFDVVEISMQQKLLCYYCLHLFLLVVWAIERAESFGKGGDGLLADVLDHQILSEPFVLMRDVFSGKITLNKPDELLTFAAVILRFLSKFTKTDGFLLAVDGLTNHV